MCSWTKSSTPRTIPRVYRTCLVGSGRGASPAPARCTLALMVKLLQCCMPRWCVASRSPLEPTVQLLHEALVREQRPSSFVHRDRQRGINRPAAAGCVVQQGQLQLGEQDTLFVGGAGRPGLLALRRWFV